MRVARSARLALLCATWAARLAAQPVGVSATVHNLSVSGPGAVKAEGETEVCKFCHVPHNPVQAVPLWGHALSGVANYDVPVLGRDRGQPQPAPQPDGASRLCLSCHDGTVALGDLGGAGRQVPMAGAQRLEKGRPGYLGTDLSGAHPVSFVVPDGDRDDARGDMGLRPLASILSEGLVRLDREGKMQCTSCHDAHADRYYQAGQVPRFWVRPTVSEVCLACHALR